MARLLLKMFLAYWIAAGVVLCVIDIGPHRHISTPELNDALSASLRMNGRLMVAAYLAGGCAAAEKTLAGPDEALFLASVDGNLLCSNPSFPGVSNLIRAAAAKDRLMTANHQSFQLMALPVHVGAGYVIILRNNFSTMLHLYGLLPGTITIAISCGVTLFLALLMALPIRRLRSAAGMIAMGKLDTRVIWNSPTNLFTGGDDIDQLCRDFNFMAEKLQSLAEAQKLLLCEVSHELRSPLARLDLGLSLARIESSPAMGVHLDRIATESGRLNQLIGQVLAVSRLSVLPNIESPSWFRLRTLVANLLPDLQYEAEQAQCNIEANMDAECPVYGDPDLLGAAIENIVRNAIKYAGSDGPIHIDLTYASEQGPVLSIRDHGAGISEGELDSVVRPFYRADRSRQWKHEGTGMGLAIADRAVRLHGGTMHIRNRRERGLSVEIRLPAAVQKEKR